MTKPTREEVEKWKYESAHSPLHGHAYENHNRLICLADAYLAQEGELEEKDRLMKSYGEMVHESYEQGFRELKRIAYLKAENQALKEALTKILGWRERDRESIGEVVRYIEELASKALGGDQP